MKRLLLFILGLFFIPSLSIAQNVLVDIQQNVEGVLDVYIIPDFSADLVLFPQSNQITLTVPFGTGLNFTTDVISYGGQSPTEGPGEWTAFPKGDDGVNDIVIFRESSGGGFEAVSGEPILLFTVEFDCGTASDGSVGVYQNIEQDNPGNRNNTFNTFIFSIPPFQFDLFNGDTGNTATCGILAPLPVEFLYFNAFPHREGAMLKWATASEENNSGFEIQRSKDGLTEWENIGWVDGNGTVSNINNYDFLDREPYDGVNYYRLRQVDFNGSFKLSLVRTVEFSSKGEEVSIFPNPVNDVLNIKLPTNIEGEVTIQLLDVSRQLIREKTQDYSGAINDEFNVSDLPAGTYFIHVISGNYVGSKPFVKKNK